MAILSASSTNGFLRPQQLKERLSWQALEYSPLFKREGDRGLT
jgi:hypothetical protein